MPDAAAQSAAPYRRDLALVHHRGFGFHADRCAPGILRLLDPVLQRGGLVLELGCGSGALTRHLVEAGHRVLATDASEAFLAMVRKEVPAADVERLVLPDEPLPRADAIVSVGHVLSYLADTAAVERALVAVAEALRPGGVVALDLCDLRWGEVRRGAPPHAQVHDDWAITTRFTVPDATTFVRDITTFVREDDGRWRRDDEQHRNVLLNTSRVPGLLARHGVEARVEASFGDEELPDGLVAVVGARLGT